VSSRLTQPSRHGAKISSRSSSFTFMSSYRWSIRSR
jgi:hypothetical protein